MEDPVHVIVGAPPTYSPTYLVHVLKKIMWSGKIWNEGYFVRSVGDEVTADVIRKYIQYQKQEDKPTQVKMFGR